MPTIGQYDFSGQCAPGQAWNYSGQQTFSVGIFQWIAGSKKPKKSAVICRVKGYTLKQSAVYTFATQLCEDLNTGKRKPEDLQKTYTVKE